MQEFRLNGWRRIGIVLSFVTLALVSASSAPVLAGYANQPMTPQRRGIILHDRKMRELWKLHRDRGPACRSVMLSSRRT
jgi:hypothetical protein